MSSRNLPRVALTVGEHKLDAWVARSAEERAQGLKFRQELETDEGMLFIGDAPTLNSFWMEDTLLPLSIAFLDDDGTILAIADMAPGSLASTKSPRPVRFVLEANAGWFHDRGIAIGMRLEGPPFLVTA